MIICIPRNNSPQELAAIYTTLDASANPTYEDNYPNVNLETKACETRVLLMILGAVRRQFSEKDFKPIFYLVFFRSLSVYITNSNANGYSAMGNCCVNCYHLKT